MLRNGITGDWIGTFLGHKGAVWSARLSTDAGKAITGSADFTAKVWNTYTGSEQTSLPHEHIVRSVDFSPDACQAITGGHEKKVRLFDLETSTPRQLQTHEGVIKSVVWDRRSENLILSAGDDKKIRWFDLRSNTIVNEFVANVMITSMEQSADGKCVTVTAGKSVYFLSSDVFTLEKQINVEYDVSSISIHPSHTKFVTGGASDLWVRVYDYPSGEELGMSGSTSSH
ncbi:Serine-threonine kinase receptor-associated protein [Neolecta irregularis DAH-3]|uniref:Serine-threonine kinase receptor-associated protein n=1 Tax=Neolecta irregularis (strain DAH-3) TaxID=1198029 RepID=A0A1U7LH98_NEOID|nr:Serine-threonine kinase receptor-associated protein [Neolecta irregularis DAH-3]|eukprot:OLL21922.1 Serine-threonine kinase receptor-associated protein [Neolecta irregularis DAH-3]